MNHLVLPNIVLTLWVLHSIDMNLKKQEGNLKDTQFILLNKHIKLLYIYIYIYIYNWIE